MNASPPNIFFSLKECSPLNRLRTRFAKRSSNGIILQRDSKPQSSVGKTVQRKPSCKRIFICATAIDCRNRDLQQAEVNGQLATVMVPVVQHNGSKQRDARNSEHFLPLKRQAPLSYGSRFADAVEVLCDSVEARVQSGENFR